MREICEISCHYGGKYGCPSFCPCFLLEKLYENLDSCKIQFFAHVFDTIYIGKNLYTHKPDYTIRVMG